MGVSSGSLLVRIGKTCISPVSVALPAELVAKGETAKVEFKVAACWDLISGKKDDRMRDNVIQEVVAFLNSEGGTVLIGIEDDGR